MAQQKLVQVADVLKQYGDEYSISVNGYTDSRGSDTHNQQLSQARAESVRNYLVSKGVAEDVVKAFGQGESAPIAGNDTAEGRADNRRVEIVVDRGAGSPQ
jgi:outer membrane protein OmpA-like peptidoglycan-associated protein